MSDQQKNKGTSVLLPSATVDFFLKDKSTIEAARALSDDWRFARVTISIEEGDVETAIQNYQQVSSPALIIIETDTTDESFTNRLEALSAYCAEGTNAIVIGPVNDVNLYRRLTAMGISDYLVRSVPTDILGETLASGLISQLGASESRLISVIGAKGGVGASSLAQCLAWGIADRVGEKTFFLDAAGGWSSLGVTMGYEPQASLAEAVRAAVNKDHDTLKRMIFQASDKLKVLACGGEAMLEASVQAQQYETLIDMMMGLNPVVVADLSSSIPSLKRTLLNRSHQIIIVTTPTLSSLRFTRSIMAEIKSLHGGSLEGVDLVLNMQGMAIGKEISLSDINTVLDQKPSAIISYDSKLFIGSENEGHAIGHHKASDEIVSRLLPLAKKVVSGSFSEAHDKKSSSDSVLDKIISKLKT
ncbi:MAG: type II secretion protein ATPase [Alphaproteobacteria bacterium]|nr:type II secretion protein ATPase [Alphaproteobacteria bacterium]